MKNKMLKRSHLSEKKCKEIIQLFSEDLTATQIASITGVSRVTINNYLKLIRTHIARFTEELHPKNKSNGNFRPQAAHNGTPAGQLNGTEPAPGVFYGFYRCEDNVFTDLLHNVDKLAIQELQRTRGVGMMGKASEELLKHHAIADFENWKLYRVDTGLVLNGRAQMDEIAVFWANAKSRLLKFRGLNKNTLYLHVKECEFRHNYRLADINSLLLNIIYKLPLHYSRANV